MIYILAGDADEAKTYCHETGLSRRHSMVISGHAVIARAQLRPGDRIVRTGTWFDRNDLGAIEPSIAQALRNADLQITTKGLVKRR